MSLSLGFEVDESPNWGISPEPIEGDVVTTALKKDQVIKYAIRKSYVCNTRANISSSLEKFLQHKKIYRVCTVHSDAFFLI